MDKSSKGQYLDVLQIFRGMAALMVVIHHTVGSLNYYHKIESPFLNFIGSIGKYGVDFFFVLSGFIITYSAYYKYNEPNAFSNYIKNRLIRIYIPYLPMGVLMVLLYSVMPGLSNSDRDLSVFTSLTLIPDGNPALSVAWTLSFELCFYILFSVSFFSKKIWHRLVGLWFALILLFNYTQFDWLQSVKVPIIQLLFSAYNIEFILGFLLAMLIVKEIKINLKYGLLILLSLVPLFLYYRFFGVQTFKFSLNLLFAIITFIMISLSIVYFNKKINNNFLLMIIGNATYSIYLIHNPLQMVMIRFFPKITSALSLVIAIVLVLVMSCLIGYMYYIVFEKKAIGWVKSKLIS